MKITFNLGTVSFTAKKEPIIVTPELVAAGEFSSRGTDVSFEMQASSYTLEAEVGEIAGIYKEVMPVISELAKTLAILKS